MHVIIAPDQHALGIYAAGTIADTVRSKPDAVLALPTGLTPRGMYAELVRKHRAEGLDFSHVITFNLDELVGPALYRTYMKSEFFDHVNVRTENIHIPDGRPGKNLGEESAHFELAIHQAGGIDLLISGIGTNGHVAFNEPGTDFNSRTRVVELAPESISGLHRQFPEIHELPVRAITMGLGTIMQARRIVLLAAGQRKAEAVRQALRGPVTVSMPASILQLHGDATAILDRDAALSLRERVG
jgi:glucosamine-6-phosphate deaminase